MMNHDDIIKEVRTIREQLAARQDYNVRALFAAAKERQQESERKVVKLVPKPVEAAVFFALIGLVFSSLVVAHAEPRPTATFEGHRDFVISLAFSPDGTMLASIAMDGTAKLWDVKKRRSIATAKGKPTHNVIAVAFSPDSATLAYTFGRGIRLWDIATRQTVAILQGSAPLAFSPDGTILASSDERLFTSVKLWDVATRTTTAILDAPLDRGGHDRALSSLAFSPDGKTIATGSQDYTVKLWDVETGHYIRTFNGHPNGYDILSNLVAFSPDGTLLVSGTEDDAPVRVWDVATGQTIATLGSARYSIWPLAFSPDGGTLAIGSDDKVQLWNVSTKENIATFKGEGYGDWAISLAFSPDGTLLASGNSAGAIRLWDTSEWVPPWPPARDDGELEGISASHDSASEPQARLTPNPAEVEFSADDPAWKTFTVHTSLDSVLVRANPPGSDPALEVAGGQRAPTRDYCPAEGNDRPTRGRRDGWSLHVKACQAGQTKILLIDYDTGAVVQQYEVNVEGSSIAATTVLNPSYPNPFNSETVLSYTLPTASDIRLEVFTLSGQRVEVLHEGFQAAGYHTIAMDASDLASGVYLYRLTTPEGRFAQKFTLLR